MYSESKSLLQIQQTAKKRNVLAGSRGKEFEQKRK